MKGKGRATLGDALSEAMRLKLDELMFELRMKANDVIDRQLRRPAPPVSRAPARARTKAQPGPERPSAQAAKPARRTPVVENKDLDDRLLIPEPRVPKDRSRAQPVRTQPERWELPPEAAVRERPPVAVSAANREAFTDVAAVGAGSRAQSKGGLLFVNIGIDFGTSSTKIIARFPFEPDEPAFAIPAPSHCRSDLHPYLWQTVLWVQPDGQFAAWPEQGALPLHALKQGLLDARHDRLIDPGTWQGNKVTRAEAAAAYLAFVIRYARGWLQRFRPMALRDRQLVWFENVGLPAATLDNAPLTEAYRRVVAAAHLVADSDEALTVELCKTFLDDPRVKDAAHTAEAAARFGIAVIPETAAEATGFFKANNASRGTYLMVDVGAMTLDACVFGYRDGSYNLYNADVRPLGVESFHWFTNQGKTEAGFGEQCERCLHEVVWTAKVQHVPQIPAWNSGNDLPAFLVGGGAQNGLHRQVVEELTPWLAQLTGNSGIRFLDLPVPRSIDWPEPLSEFSRLAVAWGLSYPPDQIGEFAPPSSIEATPPLPRGSRGKPYVSKDQV
jgi:hypothetical protein